MKPAGDESKKLPRFEPPMMPPPGSPQSYPNDALTRVLAAVLDPLLRAEGAPEHWALSSQKITVGMDKKHPTIARALAVKDGAVPEWETPSFWKNEAESWRRAGEFDLMHCANLAAKLFSEVAFSLDPRAAMLRLVVSRVILDACQIRRSFLWSRRSRMSKREQAFYVLERFYRLEFQPPMAKSKPLPEHMPDYPEALLSAKNAAWKEFGGECEKFWVETIGRNMVTAGIRKKIPPTKRIRREALPFEKTVKAFVIGNWIRCHLWLMTPDVRWMFVRKHWKRPATKKAATLEGVNAVVKRAKLWVCASPPIAGMTKAGMLILNPED